MKGIFTNYISTTKRGLLSDFKAKIQSTPLQGVLNSLNKFRQKIQNEQGSTDSLIAALTVDASLINSDIANGDTIDIEDEYLTVIPEDYEEDLLNSVKLAISKDTPPEGKGMTLSDSQGCVYNLLVYDGPQIEDGVTPLITNSLHPRSIQDCLIFRRNDVLYLNNILITSDYFRPMPGESTTILENVQATELILCGSASPDVVVSLRNICTNRGVDYLPVDSISDLLDKLSIDGVSLIDKSYNLYLEYYPLQGKGRITCLWNLLANQIESVAINETISDICGLFLSSKDYAAGLASIAANSASTKFSSVSQLTRGVSNAYNTGGLYAASSYILSYANSASSMSVDDDGLMQFSDNASLIPQQYIAGLVSNFIGTAVTLIGVVASAFSRVVGAILSGIGQLITAPFRAASYDYEQNTKAQLITDDGVIIPISPHAVFKMTTGIPLDNEHSYEVMNQAMQLVYDTKGIAYAPIPGGYAIIGPGAFTTLNGEKIVSQYNIEFHPEIIGRTGLFRWLAHELFIPQLTKGIVDTDVLSFHFSTSNFLDLQDFGLTLANAWNAAEPDTLFLDNGATEDGGQGQTGVLSDVDDKLVRKWVMQNIIIMDVYLHCIMGVNTDYKCWCKYSTSYGELENTRYADINATKIYNGLQEVTRNSASQLGNLLLAHLNEPLGSFVESSLTYFVRNEDDLATCDNTVVPTWVTIGEYVMLPIYEYASYNFWQVCVGTWALDVANTFSSSLVFALKTPKYDRGTFWFWVAVSGIITVGAIVATVAVSLKVRNYIRKRKALNQANVEGAWGELTKNSTEKNYKEYKKAVRQNNSWSRLVGGTRYNYVNYWDASSGSASDEVISNLFAPVSGSESDEGLSQQASSVSFGDLDLIKHLIVGYN